MIRYEIMRKFVDYHHDDEILVKEKNVKRIISPVSTGNSKKKKVAPNVSTNFSSHSAWALAFRILISATHGR